MPIRYPFLLLYFFLACFAESRGVTIFTDLWDEKKSVPLEKATPVPDRYADIKLDETKEPTKSLAAWLQQLGAPDYRDRKVAEKNLGSLLKSQRPEDQDKKDKILKLFARYHKHGEDVQIVQTIENLIDRAKLGINHLNWEDIACRAEKAASKLFKPFEALPPKIIAALADFDQIGNIVKCAEISVACGLALEQKKEVEAKISNLKSKLPRAITQTSDEIAGHEKDLKDLDDEINKLREAPVCLGVRDALVARFVKSGIKISDGTQMVRSPEKIFDFILRDENNQFVHAHLLPNCADPVAVHANFGPNCHLNFDLRPDKPLPLKLAFGELVDGANKERYDFSKIPALEAEAKLSFAIEKNRGQKLAYAHPPQVFLFNKSDSQYGSPPRNYAMGVAPWVQIHNKSGNQSVDEFKNEMLHSMFDRVQKVGSKIGCSELKEFSRLKGAGGNDVVPQSELPGLVPHGHGHPGGEGADDHRTHAF